MPPVVHVEDIRSPEVTVKRGHVTGNPLRKTGWENFTSPMPGTKVGGICVLNSVTGIKGVVAVIFFYYGRGIVYPVIFLGKYRHKACENA